MAAKGNMFAAFADDDVEETTQVKVVQKKPVAQVAKPVDSRPKTAKPFKNEDLVGFE